MRKLLFLLALVSTGCAPVNGAETVHASTDACFVASQVTNFRVAGGQQAYIRTQRGHVFRLDTPPNCFDAGTATLAIEPNGGAGSRMCPGEQVRVRVMDSSGGVPKTCIAPLTGPITDSSVSGLPGRS